MDRCYITVFTPTYNRKQLLIRLYESLLLQRYDCFEWLIVDDASNDGTDIVVEDIIQNHTGKFSISYYKQEHGGKHRAINYALSKAKGYYFFIVDSDDYLCKDALQKVNIWGRQVELIPDLAGLAGLRVTEKGDVIGGSPTFPSDTFVDVDNFHRKKYNLLGDKAEIYKTDILLKYLFPEFENEYFLTERVCWDSIAAAGYKIRWYNTPIYICEYLDDGLTKNGANQEKGALDNFCGYSYYVKVCLKNKDFVYGYNELKFYNQLAKKKGLRFKDKCLNVEMTPLNYVFRLYLAIPFVYIIKLFNKIFNI